MWWYEFTKRYRWAPEHEAGVKSGWRTLLTRRLSGIMGDARKNNKRPNWVCETDWARLQEYWATPTFVAKSRQASKNPKDGRGGKGPMKHTGGSLSHIEHHERLILILFFTFIYFMCFMYVLNVLMIFVNRKRRPDMQSHSRLVTIGRINTISAQRKVNGLMKNLDSYLGVPCGLSRRLKRSNSGWSASSGFADLDCAFC